MIIMNSAKLAEELRSKAAKVTDAIDPDDNDRWDHADTAELINVLARIVEGKSIASAFGAPGDWGYSHPIGKALATA